MANRPAWVVQELADILGFGRYPSLDHHESFDDLGWASLMIDEATVAEAILPELESQNHQARLQSHLQVCCYLDFGHRRSNTDIPLLPRDVL